MENAIRNNRKLTTKNRKLTNRRCWTGHALNSEMDSELLSFDQRHDRRASRFTLSVRIAGHRIILGLPPSDACRIAVAQLLPYVVRRESKFGAYVGEGERTVGIAAKDPGAGL